MNKKRGKELKSYIKSVVYLIFIFSNVLFGYLQASIIDTSTQVSMEITDITNTTTVVGTDIGATSASVSLSGPSDSSASSNIGFSSLTSDTANINFNLSYDGGNIFNGYMGEINSVPNFASITYFASIDSTLEYQWDFSYTGVEPFGLQIVVLEADGATLQTLGNHGLVSSHSGQDTFNLIAGNNYLFEVEFMPNVSGGISSISGALAGNISFDFNEASAVPTPAPLALVGLGLAAIGYKRRKTALIKP